MAIPLEPTAQAVYQSNTFANFVTSLMEQRVIGTITENLRFFPTLVGGSLIR